MFGRYEKEEYAPSKTFGIQTREDALRITNDMARLTLPKDRKIDYASIARMDNSAAKELVQDEQSYVALYQDFALNLIDISNEQPEIKQFFNSPGVFDGLVNILVQEIKKSPMRPHLAEVNSRKAVMQEIVRQFMKMCDQHNLIIHDFPEICERLSMMTLNLEKKHLNNQDAQSSESIKYKLYLRGYHKKCYHHWRPEDIRRVGLDKGMFKGFNTGGLLWGERGCGKSTILAYLTAWAHENTWVNLTVASCSEFVDATHDIERMENGLYLQHTLAQRMLSDLAI